MESQFLVKKLDNGAKLDEDDRRFLLAKMVREDQQLMEILTSMRDLDLPDWRLVSGAIYQTVWNCLTGKPKGHGIKDYDIAYFDPTDRSYDAEDRIIKQVVKALPDYGDRIEVRNQARVHLWYPQRFGGPYPELKNTDESLENYMCTTHAVAVRLEPDDAISIAAPFGLEDIFSLTIRPSTKLATNQTHYAEKAKRMVRLWPELKILDWHTGEEMRPDLL